MTYTIPNAVAWPTELRREKALAWDPDFANEVSPAAIAGNRQVNNINGGGGWVAGFYGEQLRTSAHRLAWRRMQFALRGGAVPVDLPVLFCEFQPKPLTGTDAAMVLVGASSARDLAARIDLTNADQVYAGGTYFSVYDATTYGNRLHLIETVAAVGGHATWRDITFWPPLRFDIADAAALRVKDPLCVMRLAQSNGMDVRFEMRVRADPDAIFVEAD